MNAECLLRHSGIGSMWYPFDGWYTLVDYTGYRDFVIVFVGRGCVTGCVMRR